MVRPCETSGWWLGYTMMTVRQKCGGDEASRQKKTGDQRGGIWYERDKSSTCMEKPQWWPLAGKPKEEAVQFSQNKYVYKHRCQYPCPSVRCRNLDEQPTNCLDTTKALQTCRVILLNSFRHVAPLFAETAGRGQILNDLAISHDHWFYCTVGLVENESSNGRQPQIVWMLWYNLNICCAWHHRITLKISYINSIERLYHRNCQKKLFSDNTCLEMANTVHCTCKLVNTCV